LHHALHPWPIESGGNYPDTGGKCAGCHRLKLAPQSKPRRHHTVPEGNFQDHFSAHAGDYAAHRPRYPDELWAWLAARAPGTERCWDAATGNGQAAVALARCFGEVIATDASAAQISHAPVHDGVCYRIERAEATALEDRSVDAIVVAQALHWFDFAAFFAEVRRVLRPGGVLLACCYELLDVDDGGPLDRAVRNLYTGSIGPYWPPQRRHIERGYSDIPFPFETLEPPAAEMTADWDRNALIAYIATWSAVRRHDAATGGDALAMLRPALADLWPDDHIRRVRFPLAIRAHRAP